MVDENACPNTTVRIALRSGEIKIKDGVSQKLVVTEIRTPKTKSRNNNRRTQANQPVAGPSGVHRGIQVQHRGATSSSNTHDNTVGTSADQGTGAVLVHGAQHADGE